MGLISEGTMLSVGAFIGTYLVHGTILFVLAWAGAACVRSQRVREQLWRVALFGPLVTASAQVGGGLAPLAGTWDVAAPKVAAAAPALETAGLRPLRVVAAPPARPAPAPTPRHGTWATVGLLATVLGLIAITWRAAMEAIRMGALGKRRPLRHPALAQELHDLASAAGLVRSVRLETTERGISPYATGVLRPRIVIPEGAVRRFARKEHRAMLAHELGHIVRFDSAWTAAARSVATLFFFQPLNWVLIQKLDESAEFACDEFAVALTRDEVAMARCLTSVAEMIIGREPTPACPMAHRRSKLSARVERILAAPSDPRAMGTVGRAAGVALIAATALAAPGLAMPQARPMAVLEFEAGSIAPASDPIVALYAEIERTAAAIETEAALLSTLHGARNTELEARLTRFRRRAANLGGMARTVIERRLASRGTTGPTTTGR